jgi:ABC-type uncharacterized transport system fused permease/ATPase subunit
LKRSLLFSAVLCAASLTSVHAAQPITEPEFASDIVDRYADHIFYGSGATGMALVVIDGNQRVFRSYGETRPGNNVRPHRWQYWSILGTALIIFVTWFLVEVGVAVNAWYAPFYDLIQTALSSPHKVTIEQFYREVGVFLGIALIAVVISVLNNFFVSHYVFRWRTAMNEYYMANWQQLRHIEGAAQRVQEDTMRFASTLENMGVSFINAIMTLIAFW